MPVASRPASSTRMSCFSVDPMRRRWRRPLSGRCQPAVTEIPYESSNFFHESTISPQRHRLRVGCKEGSMDFRILGAVEVFAGGQPLRLGGPRQRALLAYLLLHADESTSAQPLRGGPWGAP